MEVIETSLGELNVLTSMCPECQEEGVTRLLFVEIPHFKRIIVSSFECHNDECGLNNREVQFGDEYPPHGIRLSLNVCSSDMLNRQLVKSEFGVVSIPELELEIPANTQSGTISTIEGVMRKVMDDLMKQQEERRQMCPEIAEKIDAFIAKMESCLSLQTPFHMIIDDCSGNSHIETFPGDKHLTKTRYTRSRDQTTKIGLAVDMTYSTKRSDEEEAVVECAQMDDIYDLPETCFNCGQRGWVKMHKVDIPYFKEVIIMGFSCESCGCRNSEVRSGGAIEEKGKRITLNVLNASDLCRDVLRSETSMIRIPELDFDLESGNHVGGAFTTVEGLLNQILDHLKSTQLLSFASGDSAENKSKSLWGNFLTRLNKIKEGQEPFTLILDDPAGSVYVQNPRAHMMPPDNIDPQLVIEHYTRTAEQDDELGLTNMKTD